MHYHSSVSYPAPLNSALSSSSLFVYIVYLSVARAGAAGGKVVVVPIVYLARLQEHSNLTCMPT